MKQLTCEMCGSTDLVKQEGFFVCQTCGCKYSVEEAKKMMIEGTVEVQGAVNVQNAAQLESLMKLAHSSFDSKNYAQAEEFCNQIIAMDSLNYEAWKLKGEAINYQITAKNHRILEVYNCIMTSFNVLSEEKKKEKQEEIHESLCDCLEGEIYFWLDQLKSQRPTEALINQITETYYDCLKKIASSYRLFGLSADAAEEYIAKVEKKAARKAYNACTSSWENIVYYNYWRDGHNDDYHPNYDIFKTFVDEGDNLITFLDFLLISPARASNEDFELRIAIYESLIKYQSSVHDAKCYKRMVSTTTNGYGAVTNRREYWETDSTLSDQAREIRKKKITEYMRAIENEYTQDNEKHSVSELLALAQEEVEKNERQYARYRYDAAIKKDDTRAAAYLGKALVLDNIYAYQRVDLIITASQKSIPPEDQAYVQYLIHKPQNMLLIDSAKYANYDAVVYLLDIGADVNEKDSSNATALWHLCYSSLNQAKAPQARRIAQLLIDHGASLNVKSTGGVDLYNKNTDPEIAKMIQQKQPNLQQGKASGCYVATCVYGSYDCPQVWTLRRFRDDTLGATWYGRAFIHTYYAISPTLVKWFGKTTWFKKMWHGTLNCMVAKLNSQGVQDTPYQDKDW